MKFSGHKLERDYTPELSLTSMIDVVFLLLIFFITTSSFTRTERELTSQVRFEQAAGGKVNQHLERAVIVVEPAGDGAARYRVGLRTFTNPETLQVFLAANFRGAPQGGYVYVPPNVDFQWVAAAINACERAGVGGVSYVPK
jgi:biopolymer transport protein ExbD